MLRKFNITIDKQEYYVEMEELGVTQGTIPVTAQTPITTQEAPASSAPVSNVSAADAQQSPMPGKILDIRVNVGDSVQENQVILILEAMKLENEIVAEKAGTVTAIHTQTGATINSGDALVTIA